MLDYYKILGLKNSATVDDVKRAYRILARRYHPDINPNQSASARFREIQEAYQILSDPDKRQLYDATAEAYQKKVFEARLKSYAQGKPSASHSSTSQKSEKPKQGASDQKSRPSPWEVVSEDLAAIKEGFTDASEKLRGIFSSIKSKSWALLSGKQKKLSIVELSISVEESLKGARKKVEILEPGGARKISIQIPVGVRDGSIMRLRKKGESEEVVVIFRLAAHPYLSIKPKGLVIEVPVTVNEAIFGAQIKIPGLNDSLLVKIPPGSQSGFEVRVKGQGIQGRDSATPGDLFLRLMIMAPTESSAAGLNEVSQKLEGYYSSPVRGHFPGSILEGK